MRISRTDFSARRDQLEKHWRQSGRSEANRFVWSDAPKSACDGILEPLRR